MTKPVAGTPLPAGGGEAGAALRALVEAIGAKDWNAAKAHLSPEVAASLEPAWEVTADYWDGVFRRLAGDYPASVQILGGSAHGDRPISTSAARARTGATSRGGSAW